MLKWISDIGKKAIQFLQDSFLEWTSPARSGAFGGVVLDATRTKAQLLAENALLRQQLIVLQRHLKQPQFQPRDRFLMVVLAGFLTYWRQALLIVKPDTLVRWHKQGFKLLWKLKSKPKKAREPKPKIAEETITLIKQMAAENKLWGVKRIQGELLKLGIKVARRTVQKYMRQARTPASPRTGQKWATFLKNHSSEIWACDFLPVVDLFFGQLYAFFLVELGSRRVVHFGVSRHPTDEWVAQQLRDATHFEERPKYLIRDNDTKFGPKFGAVAKGSGIKVLKTLLRAPKANSICERFLGSVRREVLDHFLLLNERHLKRVLKAYVEYFNYYRPHQGIGQAIPIPKQEGSSPKAGGKVKSIAVLGGLHHHYERAA